MTEQEIVDGWWLVRDRHGEKKVVDIVFQLVCVAGVGSEYSIYEMKDRGYEFLRKLNLDALSNEEDICHVCTKPKSVVPVCLECFAKGLK